MHFHPLRPNTVSAFYADAVVPFSSSVAAYFKTTHRAKLTSGLNTQHRNWGTGVEQGRGTGALPIKSNQPTIKNLSK